MLFVREQIAQKCWFWETDTEFFVPIVSYIIINSEAANKVHFRACNYKYILIYTSLLVVVECCGLLHNASHFLHSVGLGSCLHVLFNYNTMNYMYRLTCNGWCDLETNFFFM